MTAAQLLIVGLACLLTALIGVLLITWLDIRAERRYQAQRLQDRIDRDHWAAMPGAVPSSDEVFDWESFDDWSVRA